MTADRFIKYLENPENITKNDYAELKQVKEQYPYFQSVHILLLKYAEQYEKNDKEKILQKSSVFITNRSRLFSLLSGKTESGKKTMKVTSGTKSKAVQRDTSQSLEEKLKKIEATTKAKTKSSDKKTSQAVSDKKPDKDKAKEKPEKKKTDLTQKGKKVHDSLMTDVFSHKAKPADDSKSKAYKEDDTEKLTNDIYNKIEGLKREHKQKTVKPKQEQKKKDLTTDLKNKTVQKSTKFEEESESVKKKATPEKGEKQSKEKTEVTGSQKTKPVEQSKKIDASGEKETTADQKKEKEEEHNESSTKENKKNNGKPKPESKESEENLTVAEKLKSRIDTLKRDVNKTGSEDIKKKSKAQSQGKTEPVDNKDSSFRLERTQKKAEKKSEDKPQKEEKSSSAADMLLDRINKFKGKSPEENNKLIDDFVKTEPRLDRKKKMDISGDAAEESTKEKATVVTELMANIYINQGYYDKAIGVFEKLILKYPEKKDYFASKIEETKELK